MFYFLDLEFPHKICYITYQYFPRQYFFPQLKEVSPFS